MVFGILVGALFTAGALAIAIARRGRAAAFREPTERILEFTSPHDGDETRRRILEGIRGSKYRIDDQDERVIVLSSMPTLFSWGFLYPVFLEAPADSGTLVRIGIKSRLAQRGLVVTIAHEDCLESVRRLVIG